MDSYTNNTAKSDTLIFLEMLKERYKHKKLNFLFQLKKLKANDLKTILIKW